MSKDARTARYKSWYGHYVARHREEYKYYATLYGGTNPPIPLPLKEYYWPSDANNAQPIVDDSVTRKVAKQNFLWRKQYVERRNK